MAIKPARRGWSIQTIKVAKLQKAEYQASSHCGQLEFILGDRDLGNSEEQEKISRLAHHGEVTMLGQLSIFTHQGFFLGHNCPFLSCKQVIKSR